MLEQTLIDRYLLAERAYNDLAKKCEEYFLSLAQAALKKGNFEKAHKVLARCPDHVTKVFIMDAIRVARGDFKKA